MKKVFVILAMVIGITAISMQAAQAKGLIIEGGWAFMIYDFSDFDDTFTLGLFFDPDVQIGPFKLIPGLDWVRLETEAGKFADLWGIHFNLYWYFLGAPGSSAISPFLGFGPSLNYLNFRGSDDDSDAGVEIFAGFNFAIRGLPIEFMLEGRYRFIDIADFNDNIGSVNLGIVIKF